MGFHRRHIDNNQVITLYREGGIDRVRDWYTKGADALVLEIGHSFGNRRFTFFTLTYNRK